MTRNTELSREKGNVKREMCKVEHWKSIINYNLIFFNILLQFNDHEMFHFWLHFTHFISLASKFGHVPVLKPHKVTRFNSVFNLDLL
jgi:hypothetical protein